tara:strand:+ start:55 stop:312 length:258 start_codon:yes stop_codon:yes gene_type:complete
MTYGISPFFILILGFIFSTIAGVLNEDQNLFFILMGLFGIFAFMGFIEQKKELEDENKSLRDQLDNRPFFMPSTKRRKRKRRKKK